MITKIILALVLPLTAFAHHHKGPHHHQPNGEIVWEDIEILEPTQPESFEVRGTYCANPWNYHEGPSFALAESNADELASKECYPYQTKRVSEFTYSEDHKCKTGLFPSTAMAKYKCAR